MKRTELGQVVRLVAAVAGPELSHYGSQAEVEAWLGSVPDRWKRLFADSNTLILVAKQCGEIIATAYARLEGDVMYFGGAYSLRPGQGAGSLLFSRRVQWGINKGATKLRTDVFADSLTSSFYTSLGMQEVRRQPDPAGFFQADIIRFEGEIALVARKIDSRPKP